MLMAGARFWPGVEGGRTQTGSEDANKSRLEHQTLGCQPSLVSPSSINLMDIFLSLFGLHCSCLVSYLGCCYCRLAPRERGLIAIIGRREKEVEMLCQTVSGGRVKMWDSLFWC
ncbi:hypothetical protein DPEC_G00358630 [Dallia pectoralis]|uniref:Uncharacterized protein n=1 Tax=Dallia pectoralis TaxID=75939 RepID=A0ACC2F0Q7_DALPE|nr:hypothetical protein DPEC_G00358630 [Dallia pectoralis]